MCKTKEEIKKDASLEKMRHELKMIWNEQILNTCIGLISDEKIEIQ